MLQESSPTSMPSPELQDRRRDYERLTKSISQLVRALTEEQWDWKPAPEQWSLGQIVDHLNHVHELMLPSMLEAIRQGHANELWRSGPFRYNLIERGVIWSMGPNAPIRQQAPGAFRPADPAPDRSEVLTLFADLQYRLIRLTEEANGLDLTRVKVASPVPPRLRISLGAWFQALVAHQENHLAQALAVAAASGYPQDLG